MARPGQREAVAGGRRAGAAHLLLEGLPLSGAAGSLARLVSVAP